MQTTFCAPSIRDPSTHQLRYHVDKCVKRARQFSLATLNHEQMSHEVSHFTGEKTESSSAEESAELGEVVIMRIRDRHNTNRATQKECVLLSVVRLSEAFEIRQTVAWTDVSLLKE